MLRQRLRDRRRGRNRTGRACDTRAPHRRRARSYGAANSRLHAPFGVATFADTLEVWTNLQNAETLVVAIVELVRVWHQRSFTAILPDAFSVRPRRTRVQERRIRFPGIGVGPPLLLRTGSIGLMRPVIAWTRENEWDSTSRFLQAATLFSKADVRSHRPIASAHL
jgi:hypothetical protein